MDVMPCFNIEVKLLTFSTWSHARDVECEV